MPIVQQLRVASHSHDAWIDITDRVREVVRGAGVQDAVVVVYVPHTTAGVTIQENADPALKRDISNAMERMFPADGDYGHCEDNAASHMKAVLTGPSVTVPVAEGQMLLGTWQGIYLCEFDGPRERTVVIQVL